VSKKLFGVSQLDEGTQLDLIRKHLKNLTTSYSDESDLFTETIQNAIDAMTVLQMRRKGYVGSLTIVLGRRKGHDHYLYVQDTGVGMNSTDLRKVFIPGYSEGKKSGQTIGHKGVGMSYVVAKSKHIAIRSISGKHEAAELTIRNTSDWVHDNEKHEPTITESFEAPVLVQDLATQIKEGTGFYFAFHPGSEPQSLDNVVRVGDGPEKELLYWAGFLSARTPLGIAKAHTSPEEHPYKVKIILDLGDEKPERRDFLRDQWRPEDGHIGYPFPETVFRVGIDTAEIDSTPSAQRHNRHARKHQAVFHEWSAQEFLDEMTNLDREVEERLRRHLGWVRGYLAYSTEILAKVNSELGVSAAKTRPVIRYGARLVVDGVPQGRPLELALTSDQGLDRQTHIVLGFNELELDTGRKFVSDEKILEGINKVTQRVVTKLKDYRPWLKIKDREEVQSNLAEWISSVESRSGDSSTRRLFDQLDLVSPSQVDPANEQEVIALWIALLTTKIVPGYQMKAQSGFNTYDALIDFEAASVSNDGDLPPKSSGMKVKKNAVLEFKWSFDSLIDDFVKKVKNPKEIDLVVCWDCPNLNLTEGTLNPTYGKWADERDLRAVSYVWRDAIDSKSFRVISLKNLLLELLAARGDQTSIGHLALLQTRDENAMV
jgi:hypothetical protein